MKRGLKASPTYARFFEQVSYNPCPDEKGTERPLFGLYQLLFNLVTILAPMKRGLKDSVRGICYAQSNRVTILAPMKRGLKACRRLRGAQDRKQLQSLPR